MAIKQLLLKFLDDDADLVRWLDAQENTSQSIRLAIRLLKDLDSGSTKLLFELFPDLEDDLDAPPPIKDDGGDFVTQRDFDLLKQLVHSLIQNKEAPAYQMVEQPLPPLPTAFGGTKTLAVVERDPDGRGDGSSANNILASLNNF